MRHWILAKIQSWKRPAILTLLFCLAPGSTAWSVTLYTDRSAWEAAVDDITTDNFNYSLAGGASVTFASGVTSTQLGTVRPTNSVNGSWWGGEIGNASGVFTAMQWDFPTSIVAFGADFSTFDHHGVRGNFDGTGDQTFGLTTNFDFFGLVGDASFSRITFVETDGNLGSTVVVDNLAFATTSAIPEPGYSPLLTAALGACLVVAVRRRRRKLDSGRAPTSSWS